MTLSELIALYRHQAFDKQEPYFCEDDVLTIYANEAQDEACRRGMLLRDSSSAMCLLTVAADDESVALDSKIIRIKRARMNGQGLVVTDVDYMDEIMPDWQDDTSRDRPTHLIEGVSTGRLFLWPRPKEPGTIRLTVERMAESMTNDVDEPEIRAETHPALVDWMLYRAYSREETEMYNESKAAIAEARFVREFGRKASGRNEAWQRHGTSVNAEPIA